MASFLGRNYAGQDVNIGDDLRVGDRISCSGLSAIGSNIDLEGRLRWTLASGEANGIDFIEGSSTNMRVWFDTSTDFLLFQAGSLGSEVTRLSIDRTNANVWAQNFNPVADNTYTLGTDSYRWQRVVCDKIGGLGLTVQSQGDIAPESDGVQSLGSATKRWHIVHLDSLGDSGQPVSVEQALIPTGSYDLGASGSKWDNVYASNLHTGIITPPILLSVTAPIVPGTTNAYNLGSSSYRWDAVYARAFDFSHSSGTASLVSNTFSIVGNAGQDARLSLHTLTDGCDLYHDTSIGKVYLAANNGGSELKQLYFETNAQGMSVFGPFRPANDNQYTCGSGSYRWTDIYATNATIQTSQQSLKTDIVNLDSTFNTAFIQALRPVTFKFVDSDSQRTHCGLIAEEVKTAFEALGKTTQQMAVFVEQTVAEYVDDDGVVHEATTRRGLRYSELIPNLIAAVQSLMTDVAALKTAIGI
jgi:hypothetical protein